MNEDTMKGNWKQFKDRVKEQWGKLTDDDLDVAVRRRGQLVGRVQQRYGRSRVEAEKSVTDWEALNPDYRRE